MKAEREPSALSQVTPLPTVTNPLELLRQPVSVPSVNSRGREVSGPHFFEPRITQWLVAFFERLHVPSEVQEVQKTASCFSAFAAASLLPDGVVLSYVGLLREMTPS